MRFRAFSLCALCALALGACGDTLQVKPIPHNILEGLILAPFPVYWAGATFQGLQITDATHDVSGAFSVQYGNCLQGGQGICVPPLRVVTSPDNSFLPGEGAGRARSLVRGVPALVDRGGRSIVLATGDVVIAIYASQARLAAAAAQNVVPISAPGAPQAPLPRRGRDSGFGGRPLPGQVPPQLQPLG